MIKNIFFDFDGVIIDSIPVKTAAFASIFEAFGQEKIGRLLAFHQDNGGLPRFDKIRHFFNVIEGGGITEEGVLEYANRFSEIVLNELTKPSYLIPESVDLIKNLAPDFNLHIVSGAEEDELKFICHKLNIDKFFKSIHGSPTLKSNLVKGLLDLERYSIDETILIGDSDNDFEAASINNVPFVGYNNLSLKNNKAHYYVESMPDFHKLILDF
jgi:HAD superfamily hydrolase (TIGR01549 family)